VKIAYPDEMKKIDRRAIEIGVPSIVLMESAAIAVANEIMKKMPKKVTLLCGRGNNAGDAYAVGRHLLANGVEVFAVMLAEPSTKDCRKNYRLFRRFGGNVIKFCDLKKHWNKIKESDVFVDGIYGTGFKGDLSSEIGELLEAVNKIHAFRVAVDIPSGVDGKNGEVRPTAFKANLTVTFGLAKPGHFFYPGRAFVGKLKIINIGFPEKLMTEEASLNLLTDKEASELLPSRPPYGHKGTFGKVLTIGGSEDYSGSVVLAALGAIKVGAGMVFTFTPEKVQSVVRNNIPEVIALAGNKPHLAITDLESILSTLSKVNVVIIGPGIGRKEETFELIKELLIESSARKIPVIVDADAIHALKSLNHDQINWENIVITPHPGEFSSITERKIEEVINNIDLVKEFSKKNKINVLLKGATSIFSSYTGEIWLNTTGNTGLAKAGSGDLLTGTIAGFIAQGIDMKAATILGAYFMGKAAEMCEIYEASMSASQVSSVYSKIFKHLNTIRASTGKIGGNHET